MVEAKKNERIVTLKKIKEIRKKFGSTVRMLKGVLIKGRKKP